MNNLKRNYIYSVIYQILIIFVPLISSPYLARVVGSDGVGTYTYTYSIVFYFTLFTLLGVNNYGNRYIAKKRDNIDELSKAFCEIYCFQLFFGIAMMILYWIYIIFICENYTKISMIQSIHILAAILDISWFYFGIEDFKKTIIKNSTVKILSLILILLFVRTRNDLVKYTLVMVISTLFSQVLLWVNINKRVKYKKIKFRDTTKHLKPNLILFVPILATSLYKYMDKVMLGLLSNVSEVAFYENGEKINSIPLQIMSALGTVMLPRISNLIENKKNKLAKKYIIKSLDMIVFMAFPMAFGLFVVGKNFAPIYFGSEFSKSGIIISLLSTTIPFSAISYIIRTEYLIPYEKEKIYIVSVFIGAALNFLLNMILIPIYQSIGACIGTIIAEIFVSLYQIIMIKDYISIKRLLRNNISKIISAIIMFVAIALMDNIIINKALLIICQIFSGVIIYICFNIKYINSLVDIKMIFKSILGGQKNEC